MMRPPRLCLLRKGRGVLSRNTSAMAVSEHEEYGRGGLAAALDAIRRPVVLFVDDDAAVAGSMLLLLETFDIDAHWASTGDEALALIDSGLRPDVIVSDFRLPNYDGAEVIRRVREVLGANLPAVLLTGDTNIKNAECTVLYKPVDAD